MAENTGISWTDATFNPWIGCTKISPGCDNCYAAQQDKFRSWTPEGWGGPRKRTSVANWRQPVKWNAARFWQCACGWRGESPIGECGSCGRHASMKEACRRVFCSSLADVFDNEVPVEWRRDLFQLIANTPNLDWLLLTKRIGNATRMMDEIAWNPVGPAGNWQPMPNVWLGATVVNQEEADRDIPKLLATPARVRFLSMEPLLGPVDITEHLWGRPKPCHDCPKDIECLCGFTRRGFFTSDAKLDWVIVGGESGPHSRPMHPAWARSLRDQCAAAGVPFHFKQWGEWAPGENVTRSRGVVDGAWLVDGRWMPSRENLADSEGHRDDEPDLYRVGKKASDRLLDGNIHEQFPEAS
jgi:protein gp37